MKSFRTILIISLWFISSVCTAGLNSDSSGFREIFIIDSISIKGNKITKQDIIFRELAFSINDSIDKDELSPSVERSKENLLKTSLFNYVYINLFAIHDNHYKIIVTLEERWYIWPSLFFNHADRNLSTWLKSGDFSRVNYGLGLNWYNFRGLQEKLFFSFHLGYTSQVSLTYTNLYIDKKRRHSLGFEAYFENQNKLDYSTFQNEPVQFKSETPIFRKQSYFIHYYYRKKLYQKHRFILSYYNLNIHDSIALLNNNFLGSSRTQLDFMVVSYLFENDHRDLKYYPLKGDYFTILFAYMGIVDKDISKPEVRIGYYKFWELSDRFYLSSGLLSSLTIKRKQPYILSTSFGYDYNLRGYEHYIVNGHNLYLFKSDLKFKLIPVKIINLKFLPFTQFNKIHFSSYLNLFFNAGYLQDYYPTYKTYDNNLVNRGLYTYGAGIDLVTYYDKMLRIDFAGNNLGEWDIFISSKIVF